MALMYFQYDKGGIIQNLIVSLQVV